MIGLFGSTRGGGQTGHHAACVGARGAELGEQLVGARVDDVVARSVFEAHLGTNGDAPADIFSLLDDVIRAMGFATKRSTAIPGKVGLSPLLYLGDDGLELLRMI